MMKRAADIDWASILWDGGEFEGPADPGTAPDDGWCVVRRDGDEDWLLDLASELPGQWLMEVFMNGGRYSVDARFGRRVRHAELAQLTCEQWDEAGGWLLEAVPAAAMTEEDLIGTALCVDTERCVALIAAANVPLEALFRTVQAAYYRVISSSGGNHRAFVRSLVLHALLVHDPLTNLGRATRQLAAWDQKATSPSKEQAVWAVRAGLQAAELTPELDWQAVETLAALRTGLDVNDH